ncbi:transcription antitermination factor NusB [Rhabdochlamydiaceae symbiont of Dictyostelium giganteum]|uniref:transcription antitermination factor NusB n=1 Tax=Rhabdochlamydiaceae symbiont of Dictyostelium giganteum TaxID=3342349 RepID=UPI00384B6804
MSLPKQKLREIVFHLLYSDHFEPFQEDNIFFLMEYHKTTKKYLFMAQDTVKAIRTSLEKIDELIQKYATGYEFDRIPQVEKSLLRLGIFEILYDQETPPKVAISEAMRLTRKFATTEGSGFINAILDTIYQAQKDPNES